MINTKKMISYGKQTIDQSDIDSVIEVLNGDWLTQGSAVETFENDLCTYFGAKHTCAVSNGTAALHLTAITLGWQPGDVVITSPITFLATVNCIIYTGATPDFVDIDQEPTPSIRIGWKKKSSTCNRMAYASNRSSVWTMQGIPVTGRHCERLQIVMSSN